MSELFDQVARLVKGHVPGSLEFLWLATGVTLVALGTPWRSSRAVGFCGVIALPIVYVVLSLPCAARAIAAPLYRYPSMAESDAPSTDVTLIAFDGDYADSRVAETARLYRVLRSKRVIVSGSPQFRDAILNAGVPPRYVVWESSARTTREQAVAMEDLIGHNHSDEVVLVASRLHMARARAACEAAGLHVLPSAAAPPDASFDSLPAAVPTPAALRLSYESIYEYLALAYYGVKGWR
jgi:uncharacterized SAM-binding protein YcdF (DUF218 family)